MADRSYRCASGRRLRFEPLECRRLLSITVDTLVDENNGIGVGAGTSLREAITAAAAGDTIEFSVTGAIKLTNPALPTIAKNLTISGPGANLLTIDANDPTPATKNGDGKRVFRIADNNPQHLLDVSISGLTLTGGDLVPGAGGGSAINSYENLVVSDCVIVGNSSGTGSFYPGGAIQSIPEGEQFGLSSSLIVRNSILSGNSAPQAEGGAIRKRLGTLLIEDCMVTGNSAYWDGGGVSASDRVSVQINRSTISDNWTTYSASTTYGKGGGVFVFDGSVSIFESTISGNTALNVGGFASDPGRTAFLTLTNSTVSGNTARVGGGIHAMGGSQITNSTLSGNNATTSGGAIEGTGVTITSSTITANTSPVSSPGAIRISLFPNTSKVSSSIIAGNTNGDVAGNTSSLGYNLVGTVTGFTATGDQKGVTNPMLGSLADNGGPTKTHAPLPGSPAIDTGNPTFNPANPDGNPNTNDAMPFDQRGTPFTRIYDGDGAGGARIDKGAVETQPVLAVMGDYDANGVVDAGDMLLWRKMQGTKGLTPYSGADGSGNGTVDQLDYHLWRFHFGSTVPNAASGSGASSENLVAGFGPLATEPSSGDSVSQPPALPGVELVSGMQAVNRTLDISPLTRASFDNVGRVSGGITMRALAKPVAPEVARRDALAAWVESAGGVRGLEAIEFEAMSGDSMEISGDDSCDALDAAFGTLMIGVSR